MTVADDRHQPLGPRFKGGALPTLCQVKHVNRCVKPFLLPPRVFCEYSTTAPQRRGAGWGEGGLEPFKPVPGLTRRRPPFSRADHFSRAERFSTLCQVKHPGSRSALSRVCAFVKKKNRRQFWPPRLFEVCQDNPPLDPGSWAINFPPTSKRGVQPVFLRFLRGLSFSVAFSLDLRWGSGPDDPP
jgi:hypothetical protein